MRDELEDLTATLGRYSRMRHWEGVLVVLAGLQKALPDRVSLLQVILAGSSLAEGEQAFLAARMYMEMAEPVVRAGTSPMQMPARVYTKELEMHPVICQIIDALVWRSRPDLPRPYGDRKQAVGRLADMRHPMAAPHLLRLAIDRFRMPTPGGSASGGAVERFDYSGIRLIAVRGLLAQRNESERIVQESGDSHIAGRRQDLIAVIDAWKCLANGDDEPIVEILERGDPTLSPLAVFALAEAGMQIGGRPLLRKYFANRGPQQSDEEVLWAITEVFGRQEAGWMLNEVVLPWLATKPEPDSRLCYLIKLLRQVPPNSEIMAYLDKCLAGLTMVAHGRALRAYANVPDKSVQDWLIPLCENIIRGNWSETIGTAPPGQRRLGLQSEPSPEDAWRLQQAALEVLRDIGGENSLDVIREARLGMEPVLFQLSFQVAEQIYWRMTGGLANESFKAAPA
jgi:hypothetical protein